jgi:hypothetical protein
MAWNPNKPKVEAVHISRPETGPTVAASNQPPNRIQEGTQISNKKQTVNRAKILKRTDDEVGNNTVGLIDIDTTIIEHLHRIQPEVTDNGEVVKVPVIYGSPERWEAVQKDGFLRDKKGQVQCPIIMIKRTSFERNDQLMTFNRELSYTVIKKHSSKNLYDPFTVLNRNGKVANPVKEIYNVAMPDQIKLVYECTVWTDYVEHMNKIVEVINWAAQEYWGDPNGFKFLTNIQNFTGTTEVPVNDERIVRSTFSLNVNGYLIPETFENRKLTTEKSLTPRQIILTEETTDDISSV